MLNIFPVEIFTDDNELSNEDKQKCGKIETTEIIDDVEVIKNIYFKYNQSSKKIFLCGKMPDNKFKFFYADVTNNTTNSSETPAQIYENILYSNFQPLVICNSFVFNLAIDTAYANDNNLDAIVLRNTAEGWDSTAWLKIIEKNNFKYINVADLNIIAPTINIIENQENTFTDISEDHQSANFLPPIVTQNNSARATFDISFAKPMDINIALDTTVSEESATATFEYTYTGKNYTFKLPEIGNVINATTTAIKATTAVEKATTAVLDLIKYPIGENSFWPQDGGNPPDVNSITGSTDVSNAGKIWEAIKAAKSVAGTGQTNVINSIGTNGITVSIGGSTTLTNGKLNIETTINESRIITASNISNLWDHGTLTVSQNNP